MTNMSLETVSFRIGQIYCYDCVRALRKFVGSMKGVDRLEVQGGTVMVYYDPDLVARQFVERVTRESIEKLGYRIEHD